VIISGIIIGSSIFGPAIAFGLGGLFSRIYVTLEGTHVTENHIVTSHVSKEYSPTF